MATAPSTEDEDIKLGEFKKETLTTYIRFGCERQLLWLLGREDERWLNEVRLLRRAPLRPETSKKLFDLGHEFEQKVYTFLQNKLLRTFAKGGQNNQVVRWKTKPKDWRERYDSMFEDGHEVAFLLEHEFEAPHALLKRWLGADPRAPVPVLDPQMQLRPDITILIKPSPREEPLRALNAQGEVFLVHPEDERVAVRFVDVKYTSRESVGKKHHIELLYYVHAFALYLDEHDLTDKFYVPLDGHGIFAQQGDEISGIFDLDDLEEMLEPLIWRDHAHLLTTVRASMTRLWEAAPLDPASVDAKLQPACVLCPFLGECQHIANYDPDDFTHPDTSVELLAYTSPSVKDQLQGHDIETIADLHESDIPDPQTPTPLASERPMLSLKARALVTGETAWASEREEGVDRHLSMALPRFSDGVVSFALEQDPTNDRIFVYGISVDIRVKDSKDKDDQLVVRPYAELHDRLWGELKAHHEAANPGTVEDLVDRVFINAALDAFIAEEQDLELEQIRDRRVIRVKRILELLTLLDRNRQSPSLEIDPSNTFQPHTLIRLHIGDYNTGKDDISERRFVRRFILDAVHAVELVALYEEVVVGLGSRKNWKTDELETCMVHPTSGIFYWSVEQLEHVRALVERHLIYLMTGSDVYNEFRQLLELVTPSESGIQWHYRNRKIFDLRAFVETTVGLPQIINYTWHETAHDILPGRPMVERRYWSPHYNYMMFVMWHETLDNGGIDDQLELVQQAREKSKTIGQLVRFFQGSARYHGTVSKRSRALATHQIASHRRDIPLEYNFIARAWALFSRLEATLQEQVAVDQRLTFPLRSIGKLVAAHVTDVQVQHDDKNVNIQFSLEGLSANVKYKPGDFVLLIHETRRDINPNPWGRDTFVLDEMEWDGGTQSYRVCAHVREHSKNDPATIIAESQLDPDGWYIYESPVDIWPRRLARVLGLRNLGSSWLGARRAFLMGLMPADEPLLPPEGNVFDIAECVMYAPELLPCLDPPETTELLTEAFPPPDSSQERAIRQTFEHPVSCILGPPGTGKSQTMASLIDEFLLRNPDRPLKVLVSASSYEPMKVAMEKLQEHRNANGEHTAAARIQKVWLRPESRDSLGRGDVRDFCIDGEKMFLDGEQVHRRKKSRLYPDEKWRMEDSLDDRFILFAVPHQLSQLIKRNSKGQDRFLHIDHFTFDLVVVDEASQMPVDQATALLPLTRRGKVSTTLLDLEEDAEVIEDKSVVETILPRNLFDEDGDHMSPDMLTKFVLVGDHNQLPPVQPVEPPRKLAAILESAFSYFQEHLEVPSTQLQTNYRSRREIVDYTNSLMLYKHEIEAYFDQHPGIEPLPSPSASLVGWLHDALSDTRVVSAIIHESRHDTAVSVLEAELVARIVSVFFRQMAPQNANEEMNFWRSEVGIVSPHNAHGRLIVRSIYEALRHASYLNDDELMRALSQTTYSVEKFQGSARGFIIASMGISSVDQIRAEETFIYDLNRLNVLTSRAVKKMLLICSRTLLDHVPITQQMVGPAARLRDYAFRYCNVGNTFEFEGEVLERRWHEPTLEDAHILTAAIKRPRGRVDSSTDPKDGYSNAILNAFLKELPPAALGALKGLSPGAIEALIVKANKTD